ncbi:hypothetical protein [Chryseobacterium sp. VAUSW3]|uniref:hypothetical protein n=1 Tax=Chryseobacterium sp. VAUSW3 TaxID=2010998 RepID=UPI00117C7189|nr:hypothetical protein [Chryseobacterium sp. VAUSW3]
MNLITKKYKLFSIIYVTILVFTFFFLLLMLYASGHKVKIGIEYYLTFFYILINTFLLFRLPKIANNNLRIIIGSLLELMLLINLIFAFYFAFDLSSENFIASFDLFSSIIMVIFIISSVILIMETYKILKIKITLN